MAVEAFSVLDDLYAYLRVSLVRDIRGLPGTCLDTALKARLEQGFGNIGRKSYTALVSLCFFGYGNIHREVLRVKG